jgi:hypothetical protein
MVAKHGWGGARLIALPAAAMVRGMGLSLIRLKPQWIPYYLFFAAGNYAAMASSFARLPRAMS